MLVVVTIIGLFVALVGPKLWSRVDSARNTAARTQIANFKTALGTYKLDTSLFPTTEQGLAALRVKPCGTGTVERPLHASGHSERPMGARLRLQVPG